MDELIQGVIAVIILFPIFIVMHEIGHCICAMLMGGKITHIRLGLGPKLIKIGLLTINIYYFAGGEFGYKDLKFKSKKSRVFILLGGVLMNLILGIIFLLIPNPKNVMVGVLFDLATKVNFFIFICNLIPIKMNGMNTDGKQIFDILKYGKSTLWGELSD